MVGGLWLVVGGFKFLVLGFLVQSNHLFKEPHEFLLAYFQVLLNDFIQQAWPNCFVSMNWHTCFPSIRMSKTMMASSYTSFPETQFFQNSK